MCIYQTNLNSITEIRTINMRIIILKKPNFSVVCLNVGVCVRKIKRVCVREKIGCHTDTVGNYITDVAGYW